MIEPGKRRSLTKPDNPADKFILLKLFFVVVVCLFVFFFFFFLFFCFLLFFVFCCCCFFLFFFCCCFFGHLPNREYFDGLYLHVYTFNMSMLVVSKMDHYKL